MSHGESCAGVVASGVGGVVGHKKLRRKRKELDALVAEDKVRRKPATSSHHDLLRSDSEDPEGDFSGVAVLGKQMMGGRGGLWACLPGACTLLLLLTTLVGVAAAFRLLMLTRRDLDALHARISSVEASSSELPAKFHQSHVRLQELEKNQSALWAAVTQLTSSLDAVTKRVDLLEGGVKGIENSLNTSPQLSSLPKDVAALQGSVATFGSSLTDAQSSLEEIKKEHDKLTVDVREAANTIEKLREDISVLQNQTVMEHSGGRGSPATLGESVVALKEKMDSLTSAITSINASFNQQATDTSLTNHRLQSLEEASTNVSANLSQRVSSLEAWHSLVTPDLPSHITNLSTTVASLQDASLLQSHAVHNLTQSMDVVKGVEKRLEGSQVQLASSVSELKQQLQKVEKTVTTIKAAAAAATTQAPAAPPTKHTATSRD
ncbi:hypothetical protein O3P69_005526 [Scylla paramamosain]|uniref:EF-hand calcium-binding domain-containing protein 14 n=1 Tax=Scylla paramamosain TaxID=85552 RepID=A0AAW0U9T4_SCYPA